MSATIYTTPDCAYCRLAKEFFVKNKLSYVEVDISADQQATELILEKTGQFGVPVIIVRKEDVEDAFEDVIVGFDEEKLRQIFEI